MDSLSCKLEYIIFENKDKHYVVGSFSDTSTYHLFTAAGRIVDPIEDQEYELIGEFIKHPKYGSQFKIASSKKILPTHEHAIVHFLSSDAFPTIGRQTAKLIYDTLGETCLEQIQTDPSVLYQVEHLTKKKMDIIQKGIADFTGFNEVYLELMQYGLEDRKIQLLEEAYGDSILEVLQQDCFQPYYEIYGFGYKSALKLADGLKYDPFDLRRLDALVYETTRQQSMLTGNTYVMVASLFESLRNVPMEALLASLDRLSVQKSIHQEDGRVYPFSLYDDEIIIAQGVKEHIFPVESADADFMEEKINEAEFAFAITYDEVQKEAIRLFFQKSFFILNGGPGTGKTTTVKGILKICRALYPDATIQLCAPTGRASKRLAMLSDCDSRTIHSLLQWNKEDNSFAKNEEEPLDIDFLIVDEFSMVDTHLFASLLKALPSRCRILLIGDEDQLESVAPGKVFEDLIASGICPIIHLEKIFRQQDGSGIVTLAKNIRKEECCEYADGVLFVEEDASRILSSLEEATKDLEDDVYQILAPMYKGAAGIDAINAQMQAIHNPPSKTKKEHKVGATIFREQDKVMLLKNLPEDDVYNGDIGRIVEISKVDKQVTISVDFMNTIVDFSMDFLYYLSHAYCISVHKAQGSEYEKVFLICEPSSRYMLDKRLLYTGVSRAKKSLTILGNRSLFEKQVRLKQKRIRQTTLVQRIME